MAEQLHVTHVQVPAGGRAGGARSRCAPAAACAPSSRPRAPSTPPPLTLPQVVTVTGQRRRLDLRGPATVGEVYDAAAAALPLAPGRFKLMLRGALVPPGDRSALLTLVDGGARLLARQGGFGGAAAAFLVPHACAAAAAGRATPGPCALSPPPRPPNPTHHPPAPPPAPPADSLVVVPQRRAPTEAAAAAAAEARGLAPPGGEDDDDGPVTFRLPPDAPGWHRGLASFLRGRLGAPDLALVWLFTLGPGRLVVFFAVLAGARVASAYGLGPLYIMAAILVAIWTNLGDRREGEASAYRCARACVGGLREVGGAGVGWLARPFRGKSSPRERRALPPAARPPLAAPHPRTLPRPPACSTRACAGCRGSSTPPRSTARSAAARASGDAADAAAAATPCRWRASWRRAPLSFVLIGALA
jgi:hypothetical protein